MGLDMYLTKKTYVKNWDHMTKKERTVVTVKRDGKLLEGIDSKRISYIEEEVGYWRKANHIHKWFVDNVQGYEDNCGTYDVSEEQLKELLDICEKVIEGSKLVKGKIKNGTSYKDGESFDNIEDGELIEDPKVADKLLPTTAGFFFGSTEYNKWYLDDVIYTRDLIKGLLKEKGDGYFQYHSSW